MFIVEILLPRFDNDRNPFPYSSYDRVRRELTERFGGVTAFVRSPALGVWENRHGVVQTDEILIFEVMVEELDRLWWKAYQMQLRTDFRQEELVLRATESTRL